MQVPRLTKRVQTSGRPATGVDPSASLATFGGGDSARQSFNAAEQLVGQEGNRILAEEAQATKERNAMFAAEKKKADDIAIQDIDLASAEDQAAIEREVKSLKGRDALKAMDIAEEKWTKLSTERKNSVYSEEQREAADKIITARQQMLYKAAQNHTFVETERYDDEQTEKAVSTYRHSANYNDPETIGLSIYQQEMALTKYAARKGMPAEWLQDETAKARSKTHANVLEGMLVDGKESQAQTYATKHRDEILPDQLAIIGRIRREQEQKRGEADETYRNELYMKVHEAVGHEASDSMLRQIDTDLKEGRIDRGFHSTLRTRLLNVNDDPAIGGEEKAARRLEMVRKFSEIGGALNEKGTGPAAPLERQKRDKTDDIKAFRNFVLESAPYLTKAEEKMLLGYTQDANDNPRISIWERMMETIFGTPNTTPAEASKAALAAMEKVVDPKLPLEEATKNAQEIGQAHVIKRNPNRSRYQVGQVLTNANGIRAEVTGFDERGNPTLKVLK